MKVTEALEPDRKRHQLSLGIHTSFITIKVVNISMKTS